jgi:competence protein ComEA
MDLPDDPQDHGLIANWRSYTLPIILGSGSLFLIILSIILLIKSTQTTTPIEFSHQGMVEGVSSQASSSANLGTILVDVEGSVVRPGVVRVVAGSRVEDVIQAAGGLQNDADEVYISQNINRAMKVGDGMKIYIPSLKETKTSYNPILSNASGKTSHNYGNGVATSGQPSQNGSFVSINMASKAQLETLPGVGPVTAQKIIDTRPYERLEDLVTKKAIGPSLFEKLKNMLSL